jgi:formate dehydrogenase iron-sulfur subunit
MAAEITVRHSNQTRHKYVAEGRAVGFFTDPTVCIGCKACEVACKEWNHVPEDGLVWTGRSYDNSGSLGASTWRHVKFVEMDRQLGQQVAGPMSGMASTSTTSSVPGGKENPFGWLFLSDVCKHCEHAGCLEACPTGAIFRTEVSTVYVQDDVCNGCGYCVVGCPFGVIDRRPAPLPGAGGAFKCTFCYDRQIDGLTPACAKACPTESIQFGPLDELHARAEKRVADLQARGFADAQVYNPVDTSVGGIHAFFLLLGRPEEFGLPPRPEVPTIHLRGAWLSAAMTSALALAGACLAFAVM